MTCLRLTTRLSSVYQQRYDEWLSQPWQLARQLTGTTDECAVGPALGLHAPSKPLSMIDGAQ